MLSSSVSSSFETFCDVGRLCVCSPRPPRFLPAQCLRSQCSGLMSHGLQKHRSTLVMDTGLLSQTCCICMGELQNEPVHSLSCGHAFHTGCILSWAQSDSDAHGSCPICRHGQQAEFQVSRDIFPLYWHKSNFARVLKQMEHASKHMDDHSLQMFETLRRDTDRTQQRFDKVAADYKQFCSANREVLDRYKRLQKTRQRAQVALHTARRCLLCQYPVTNIMVYKERARRGETVSVIRRSERLQSREDDASGSEHA